MMILELLESVSPHFELGNRTVQEEGCGFNSQGISGFQCGFLPGGSALSLQFTDRHFMLTG